MSSLGKIALLRPPQGNSPLGWRQGWEQGFSYSKTTDVNQNKLPAVLHRSSRLPSDLIITLNVSAADTNLEIPVNCLMQENTVLPHPCMLQLNKTSACLQYQLSGDQESEASQEHARRPDFKNKNKIIFRHCLFCSKRGIC